MLLRGYLFLNENNLENVMYHQIWRAPSQHFPSLSSILLCSPGRPRASDPPGSASHKLEFEANTTLPGLPPFTSGAHLCMWFSCLCRDSTSRPQLTMTQRQRDQLSCHLTVLLLAKTKGEKLHHEPRLLNRAAEHQAESSEDYIFTRCTPR